MDALLAAAQAQQGGQQAPVASVAAAPAIALALGGDHGGAVIDSLIDSVVGHPAAAAGPEGAPAGAAGAPQSVDLGALLAIQVGADAGHAPVPAPVFNFDHAGAELLAAAHA